MNNHFNKRGRNHQRRRQGVNPNRALDSNGPDVRIRGTAQQIYDKYLALARDATSSGDRVKAENYLQHAEHYFRVLRSVQGPQAQPFESQDGDYDGEQPQVGETREQRPSSSGIEDGETDERTDEQPAEVVGNGASDESDSADSAQAQRTQSPEQDGGRRRRRRPRRPREEQGSDEGADESSETVTA